MKALRPIVEKNSDYEKLEQKLDTFFQELIYKPILVIIHKTINAKDYQNASSELLNAIRQQRIQYSNGGFTGRFGSKVSKELRAMGATWSNKLSSWRISDNKLSMDIKQVIGQVFYKYKKMNDEIQEYLKSLNTNESILRLDFVPDYTLIVKGLEKEYQAIARAVSIPPQISDTGVKMIAEKYSTNMKFYIKDWLPKNIIKLRSKVETNYYQGCRASSLVKDIQVNYGVSKNKAKFLARQETSLLTAEYTVNRYQDLGSTRWKWSTSHDSVVRDDHKELDGQIFTYNYPPVIDKKTGQKGFPRQAFGCRCKCIPLI